MDVRVALLALLLMLAPAAAQWPSFHGDERNTGAGDAAYKVGNGVLWTQATGAGQIDASPIVKDGNLVVAGWDKVLRVLDASTGAPKWNATFEDRILGTPAIDGGRLFAVDIKGNLKAFDLRDGTVLATRTLGTTFGSITAHEGKVYVGAEDGKLRAFDGELLTPLWTFDTTSVGLTGTWNNSTKTTACGNALPRGEIRVAPVVYKGKVIFGALNNFVYAVSEEGNPDKTTNVQWIFETGDIVWASPVVDQARDRVIIGSYDKRVYALPTSPLGAGGSACYGALNKAAWTVVVPSTVGNSNVRATPATDEARVYVGALNGHVHALDAATGNGLWAVDTGAPVAASPLVAGGKVLVANDAGVLRWYNATDGTMLHSYTAGGPFKASPAAFGDRTVAVSFDATIHVLGPVVPPKPDLAVAALARDGDALVATVRNAGGADAPATRLDAATIGTVFGNATVPPLAAGTEAAVRIPLPDRNATPVTATVDADGLIHEEREDNNALTAAVPAYSEPTPTPSPTFDTFCDIDPDGPECLGDSAPGPTTDGPTSTEGIPAPGIALVLGILGATAYRNRTTNRK